MGPTIEMISIWLFFNLKSYLYYVKNV